MKQTSLSLEIFIPFQYMCKNNLKTNCIRKYPIFKIKKNEHNLFVLYGLSSRTDLKTILGGGGSDQKI